MISFKFSGVSFDTISQNAPADAEIGYGKDTAATVYVDDASTATLNVYINGSFYDSFAQSGKIVRFTIRSDRLTEEPGKKNVVSVIGKDTNGETTVKNYYTIIKEDPKVITGDANGDCEVDMKDVLQIRRAIAGIALLDPVRALCADVDGNGSVDMKDVLRLRRIIAGLDV